MIGEYNGYKAAGEALGYTSDYMSMLANGQRKSKRIQVIIQTPRSYQVKQYKDNVLVATYPSLTSATEAVGANVDSIKDSARRGKIYRGFTWKIIH